MVEVVFTMTSPACGESYDATIDGVDVGRVRLRYGRFCAHQADNTKLLLVDVRADGLDGCFYPDMAMRDAYLGIAAEALAAAAGHDTEVVVSVESDFDYDGNLRDWGARVDGAAW
ncbi:MAG: hypothetical protein FWD75_06545 [Propionibacteriaceae bacterium]|nr:hypothetical protein [Propionibacteriaceae bacterium]